MGTRRRVFPEAFKQEAVDRVTSSGLSTGQVAQELATLPPSSSVTFVLAGGFGLFGWVSGGIWRGAFDLAQRQIPSRMEGGGEGGWGLPADCGVRA